MCEDSDLAEVVTPLLPASLTPKIPSETTPLENKIDPQRHAAIGLPLSISSLGTHLVVD